MHLVRHGQSSWNAQQRVQGQTARIPLTELGERQAMDASIRLAPSGAGTIYSSDLLRAIQTARPIAGRLGRPVLTDPDLREQSLGKLEGRSSAAAWQAAEPADWADPDWRPGGGESIRAVHARVLRFLDRLRRGADGSPVVVVTHGDIARVLLGVLRGHPADRLPWTALANGEVVTVSYPAETRSAAARPSRVRPALAGREEPDHA